MTAEPPRPSFTPQPAVVAAAPESRVIVVHHGGPSFFSTYWMLRLGIVALVLLGSGGRWMIHHFGGSHAGQETLDAFDDPAPVAAAPPPAASPTPPPIAAHVAPPPVTPHVPPPPPPSLPPGHHVRR